MWQNGAGGAQQASAYGAQQGCASKAHEHEGRRRRRYSRRSRCCCSTSSICKRGKMYNKKFDRIYLFSPSLGTIDDCPFEKLGDDQKYEELSEDILEGVLDEIRDQPHKDPDDISNNPTHITLRLLFLDDDDLPMR